MLIKEKKIKIMQTITIAEFLRALAINLTSVVNFFIRLNDVSTDMSTSAKKQCSKRIGLKLIVNVLA